MPHHVQVDDGALGNTPLPLQRRRNAGMWRHRLRRCLRRSGHQGLYTSLYICIPYKVVKGVPRLRRAPSFQTCTSLSGSAGMPPPNGVGCIINGCGSAGLWQCRSSLPASPRLSRQSAVHGATHLPGADEVQPGRLEEGVHELGVVARGARRALQHVTRRPLLRRHLQSRLRSSARVLNVPGTCRWYRRRGGHTQPRQ